MIYNGTIFIFCIFLCFKDEKVEIVPVEPINLKDEKSKKNKTNNNSKKPQPKPELQAKMGKKVNEQQSIDSKPVSVSNQNEPMSADKKKQPKSQPEGKLSREKTKRTIEKKHQRSMSSSPERKDSVKNKPGKQVFKSEKTGANKPKPKPVGLPNPNDTNSNNSNYEDLVKLVIKNDDKPEENGSNHNTSRDYVEQQAAKRKATSLFEQQRIILKSLYEIRRCRINNRDVNSFFIRHYFIFD